MLTILIRHFSSLTTALKCFQEMQSGPGVDKSLHLMIVLLDSSLEKGIYTKGDFNGISSKILGFI